MQKYKSNITSTSGAAIRGVPVLVIAEDGDNATLFLDRAGTYPAPNPLTTGPDGVFYFYAVNGRYSLRTTVDGVTITDDDVVLMMDPAEITVAGPIAEAVAAAQAAATAAETAVANSGIPVLVSSAQNAVVDANAALAQAIASSNSAALSKTDADAARDAAVTAKNAAAAALDSFDDRYLGAKAVAPTVDNDGAALLIGALYWDTALPGMRSWNGSAWVTLQAATAAAISNTPAGGISSTTVQDAINELATEKANLASPAFTDTPTAPTAAPGTNTTQLATTEYARAAAIAFGGIKAYATRAEAEIAATLLPDGADVEVSQDESLSGARTRYKVQAGALVFVVNLDQLRLDLANASALDPAKGAAMVGYQGETLAGVIARHEGLSVYVESFRKDGAIARSDSNAMRAALAFIQTTQAGRISRLIFEAGRIYTYDRTAELTTINDLTLDLNGATLVRAAAATTRTTLAQAAGTGQSTLYLAAIPANWEVGDYLTAYTDNTDANTSKNIVVIQSIVPAENRVTVNAGFGPVGALTTTLPVGTKVAKKFQAFAGRPASTEAGIPTSGGVNSNIHIINGAIDGNSSNQENNSWYFNTEILLHGRASSVRNMRFRNTAGECIVGHGLRVDGNEFRNLRGSAFHLSMHDDSSTASSASWFTNNATNGTNLATQVVSGHAEGAVTFSWGAGRLIVSGNELRIGNSTA